jgi:hypothetical protein
MSLLAKVTTGVVTKPHLVLVYGPDGVGKSTLGAQAPKPIFLGSEAGTDNLDVARFPKLTSTQDAFLAVKALIEEEHDYKTLVIDSVDWLETILHGDICRSHNVKSIELAAGGYGKGYVEAFNWWNTFRQLLDELRDRKKMNVVLIGHSDIVTFNDPNTQSTYERYQLKLHKKSAALLREWVDCVFFVNFETFTKKEGNNRVRAFGDGARLIYTERRPGFDAKNRKALPPSIPLGWDEYEAAAVTSKATPETFLRQIEELLKEVQDQELVRIVRETCEGSKDNLVKLEAVLNKLRIRLEGSAT